MFYSTLKITPLPFLLFLFSFLPFSGTCQEHGHSTQETQEKETFNAGKMILEHIADAHDWHIMDIGGHPVSVALPIIIYTVDNGFVCFSSARFEHGHATYQGFGLKDGKIIGVNENTHAHENVDEEGNPVVEAHNELNPDNLVFREASLSGIISKVPGSFIDLSITKNVTGILICCTLLLVVFISTASKYNKNKGKAPSGLQSFLEPLIMFVRDEIAKPSIGHHYEKYMPFLLTIFFFIWLNNMMGLIPIFPFGFNVTGNIAVTLVLALFTFGVTTINGNKHYWVHIFNTPGVPWWLKFPVPLMPIVEIVGMLSKPFVLMLRLFANITAGHIIVLAFFSLIFIFGQKHAGLGYGVSVISVLFSIFMNFLELLVAFLQAYVFTLLSAIYFGLATEEHH